MSVSFSSLYRKVFFFYLLYIWIASIGVKKIEKEAKRKYSNRRNGRRPYGDGRRSGWHPSLYLSISRSLSPFSVKWSNLSFFLFSYFKRLVPFIPKAPKQCFNVVNHYSLFIEFKSSNFALKLVLCRKLKRFFLFLHFPWLFKSIHINSWHIVWHPSHLAFHHI